MSLENIQSVFVLLSKYLFYWSDSMNKDSMWHAWRRK